MILLLLGKLLAQVRGLKSKTSFIINVCFVCVCVCGSVCVFLYLLYTEYQNIYSTTFYILLWTFYT